MDSQNKYKIYFSFFVEFWPLTFFEKIEIVVTRRVGGKKATTITGVGHYLLDEKEVASFFKSKFATSTNVSENESGKSEIFMQGNLADAAKESLSQMYFIPDQYISITDKTAKKTKK